MNILIIASHPDDEILGCGGSIARHVEAGDTVHTLILGQGATSRCTSRASRQASMSVKRLQTQARKAADVLGVSSVSFGDLPDQRFDTLPLLEITQMIESHIRLVAPNVIYTQFVADLNLDHHIVARAVATATRPISRLAVRVLSFEVLSSTEWAFGTTGRGFSPNVFTNLERRHMDLKLEAMRCYADELRDWPHPRSLQGIEALAEVRGCTIGHPWAEAFELLREVIL
jgi:LmbE family N-acetylglucosaminyl deacetylase